jgi:hypothetical protein
MRSKFVLAASTAALFLAAGGFAQAQQSSTQSSTSSASRSATAMPTLHETKSDDATAKMLNIRAKDLRSMAIYGSDGKKIADVDNVLADQSNDIKAITADVGGFLGVGAHEVVIPVDKLHKGTDKDRLMTSLTKDELQRLDRWSEQGSGSTSSSSTSSTSPSSASPSSASPAAPAARPAPSSTPR